MSRISSPSRLREPAGLRAFASLLAIWLSSGCIDGASYEPGETDTPEAFVSDARSDAVARDLFTDMSSDASQRGEDADAALPDIASISDINDVDAGGETISVSDIEAADGLVSDSQVSPSPCQSDPECAGRLGEAPGPCLVAACHPQARRCYWRALPNGSPAATDDPCVLAAQCVLGAPVTVVAATCDDGNRCTHDRCEAGVGCVHDALDGGACDDANACSAEGSCVAGVCVSATNSCPCEGDEDCAPYDDADLCNGRLTCDGGICAVAPDSVVRCAAPDEPGCTRLVCVPETGACEPRPAPDGSACEDGDACTVGDVCEAGVCVAGGALDCDDANPCTDETCDSAAGCAWSPLDADACDDGDPCTGGDTCLDGLCDGEPLAVCACDGDQDCVEHDDDDRCNGVLRCVDDVCALDRSAVVVCGGVPRDCGGLDCACARPICDSATGECTFAPLSDDRFCADDDACTLGEYCANGRCEPGLTVSCDDGNPCTSDRCDPALGCVFEPSDGSCDDGVACTSSDRCEAGACAGTPYACDDGKPCTTERCLGDGSCSPPILEADFCDIDGVGCMASGTPHPDDPCLQCAPDVAPRDWSPAGDGGPCDDGDACTEDDMCTGGVCAGVGVALDDGNKCTDDSCDPVTGVTHTLRDSEPCVTDDAPCPLAGECQWIDGEARCVGAPVDCDDDDPCTDDLCDPETPGGCLHEWNAAPCDDGDPCTLDDACAEGVCAAGPTAFDCDDQVDCTVDTCVPDVGCQNAPDDAACDDGNPCTLDSCDQDAGCGHVDQEDGTDCGADHECVAGTCVWAVSCGATTCPALADYDASCNARDHCEYARTEPTEPWHEWNVWIWVPPGTFPMGAPDGEGDAAERPQHDVDFREGYFVDKYEVTAGAFAAWLGDRPDGNTCTYGGASAECLDADSSIRNVDWDGVAATPRSDCELTVEGTAGSCSHHPVVNVTWYAAGAFCAETGGHLCTEAEWERAAKGETDRVYPWGAEAPGRALANCGDSVCSDGFERTAPVGTFPAGASPVGALDMAGNVWELTEDCWHAAYDLDGDGASDAPAAGRIAWTTACSSQARVMRGGAWYSYPDRDELRVFDRDGSAPDASDNVIGFRCCRDLPCPPGEERTPAGCAIAGADCGGHDDGVLCQDGDACTVGDACASDICVPGSTLDCGADHACADGECVWLGSCDGVECPPLPDYEASCNAQAHCEYAYAGDDPASWRQWDAWIWVPPGRFEMGGPEEEGGPGDERPVHDVSFPAGYFVAKYEVVVEQYEACEAGGACSPPDVSGWDGQGWGVNRSPDRADHPQNGLSRAQAAAFCAWATPGGRLPSEAAWEYAATGSVHATYPWGDEPAPDCDRAVFNPSGEIAGYGCESGGTEPVTTRSAGASAVGALHMAGNVAEWTTDCYHATYDGAPGDGSASTSDCASTDAVVRGGLFSAAARDLRSAARLVRNDDNQDAGIGARCVRELSPIGVYCQSAACPALPGYDVTCNGKDHCEYTRADATEPWHAWDIWIWVPPGTFPMGAPGGEGETNEQPQHDVTLSRGYFVHRHEVTAAAYAAFLDDRGDNVCDSEGEPVDCVSPASQVGSLGWDGAAASVRSICMGSPDGPATGGCAAHPASFIGWDGARAYCEWVGGRLPTEAEWERAAKGASHQLYPWGDAAPDPTRANCDEELCGDGYNGSPGTAPVGSFPDGASAIGALDMAGNLWEWVADRYGKTYFEMSPLLDPLGPDEGTERVLRGGSAYDTGIRASRRRGVSPTDLSYYAGFRCARDVPCADGEVATPDGCAVLGVDCAGHANGVLCDDGDACTAGDTCQAGVCTPGPAPDCDDGESCTVDVCVDGIGCVSSPVDDETGCGEGSFCMSGECTWGGSCGGVACPTLPGMTAQCNADRYCEYASHDASPPNRWDVWIWLPPGSFLMGAPESEDGSSEDERPTRLVTFAGGFFIAKYEIVVEQYEACVAEGACTPPALQPATGVGTDWGTNRSALDRGEHPQNGIDLGQTEAFCAWLAPGGAVPSEAEWEYAATGSVHQMFPWGDAPPSCVDELAAFDDGDNPGCGTGGTVPVTDFASGVAASGAVHMAGNVSEWVADCWHDHYNPVYVPTDGSAWNTECYAVDSHTYRNGSFVDSYEELRTASRGNTAPDATHVFLGGRCVRHDACDDGVACTSDTYAVASGCTNTPEDVACDDGNPCTTDACDAEVGCLNVPNEDGSACGDGAECVAGECLWLGTCGGAECPDLQEYSVGCNEQAHCEYVYAGDDTAEWRAQDEWIWVPPGSFEMGRPTEEIGGDNELPQHTVTFATGFFVGKYEVTVRHYEACESETPDTCTAPDDTHATDWGVNRSTNERPLHPQNGLSWPQSEAVCAWMGGRLATEAEWEYAAKGPVHRKYPWGDAPEPTCANGTAIFNEAGGVDGAGCGTGGTFTVGSRPAGVAWCGAHDMAGNVGEWVRDSYQVSYDAAPVDGSAWILPEGDHRVVRGGPFIYDSDFLRSAHRGANPPNSQNNYTGTRCVRDAAPGGLHCNDACPALPGYDVACNAQNHCEYTRSEPTEPWHQWDVWIWMPPGPFEMGSPPEEGVATAVPLHTVTFATGYFIGKFPIVVEEYEACIEDDGACGAPDVIENPADFSASSSAVGRGDHPQNGLTLWAVERFCSWVTPRGRAPTEAEWEYAASGPRHRRYAWGNAPEPRCDALVAAFNDTVDGTGPGCGTGQTWPAGAAEAGVSAAGAFDMAGNVWEWTLDCWHDTYDGAPTDGSAWTTDCDTSDPSRRVVRGTSFWTDRLDFLQLATRINSDPGLRSAQYGGRCVRELPCASGETATPDGCAITGADCAGHTDGVLCQDGNACTAPDVCMSGVCVPGPVCDDGDPCTADACDAERDTCVHTGLPAGSQCGEDAACIDGACVSLCTTEPCPVGYQLFDGCHCRVPPSGVTSCSNGTDMVPCDEIATGQPYYGQDGHYPSGTPLFVDQGDGTAREAATQMLWTNDIVDLVSWSGAAQLCADHVAEDPTITWRVPHPREWLAALSYPGGNLSGPFGPLPSPFWFWTSVPRWGNPATGDAYAVSIHSGEVDAGEAGGADQVRCVADSGARPPGHDFVAIGDGRVFDRVSGLAWRTDVACTSCNWGSALGACGGDGWRLPNVKELAFLVDWSLEHGLPHPVIGELGPFTPSVFWTATPSSSFEAYVVGFEIGRVWRESTAGGTERNARCVRDSLW